MRHPCFVSLSFLVFAVSLVLSGCGSTQMSISPASSDPQTGTPPTVSAVVVQVNGVAPNRKQEVQFSEAMDPATINPQSFQVTDSSGKLAQGSVSYDPDFEIASFLPIPALQTGATYTVAITTAVASAGGMHLASPYSYSFATRSYTDASPISVNSVVPAANATCVSANTPITITFDEAPDASTVNSTNIVVTGPGGAVIPVTMSINVTTTQVVLTPKSALPSGTITVTVQNVGDLADVLMTSPYTWSFSTACSGIEHLYVTNQAGGSISLYDMDSTTGELVSVTTFATPRVPISLSFNASGTYAYLTSGYPGTSGFPGPAITTYAVDATTGSFTQVASVSLSAPSVAKIDPSGNYLVVGEVESGTVSTYHLNPDGSISPAGSMTASNLLGNVEFVSPGIAYAGGPGDFLTQISFSSSTGAVSEVGTTSLSEPPPGFGYEPTGIYVTLHPSGKYLYAVDLSPGSVTGFFVDPTSGALTQFPGAPYSPPGFGPLGSAFAASGNFLYFGDWSVGSISVGGIMGLRVGSDGSLSALQTALTVTPLGGNIYLTADPSGKFLYAISVDSDQITGYSVDQTTGALTQIPGLLLPTGNLPVEAVFAP